jgi:hypothetical protein
MSKLIFVTTTLLAGFGGGQAVVAQKAVNQGAYAVYQPVPTC